MGRAAFRRRALMAEVFTPTTAVHLVTYEVQALNLDWARSRIQVWVRNPAGQTQAFKYEGAPAAQMMRVLNKADLRNNSLHKRILERLAADGHIEPGTVEGAPD